MLVARLARPPVHAHAKKCGKLRRTGGACEGRLNGRTIPETTAVDVAASREEWNNEREE